jgi:GTPase SAR1 family protein
MQQVEERCPSDIQVMLIGNKCDLSNKRMVSKESGEKLANEYGLKFMETSATNKSIIDEVFYMLVRDILPKYESKLNVSDRL